MADLAGCRVLGSVAVDSRGWAVLLDCSRGAGTSMWLSSPGAGLAIAAATATEPSWCTSYLRTLSTALVHVPFGNS